MKILKKNKDYYKPQCWEYWILLNIGEQNESLVCSYNFMLSRQFGNNEEEDDRETIVLNESKQEDECTIS